MEFNNLASATNFLNQVGIELKRAERYRVFISLIVIDLGFVDDLFKGKSSDIMDKITNLARDNIRGSDIISNINNRCLAILFPETSRQGAELTLKRLSEIIRKSLTEITETSIDKVIPLEMTSYPDTAGAKSINAFLEDLAEKSRN